MSLKNIKPRKINTTNWLKGKLAEEGPLFKLKGNTRGAQKASPRVFRAYLPQLSLSLRKIMPASDCGNSIKTLPISLFSVDKNL